MKRLPIFGILAATALLGAGIAYAQVATVPLVGTADLVAIVPAGAATAQSSFATTKQVAQIGAGLYALSTATATGTGTSEQTLGTYSLPANWLNYTGRRIRACAVFTTAANTNNKTAKIYFGSESATTPTMATSGELARLCVDATKSGASTQNVTGRGIANVTPIAMTYTAATETDTSAITIKATCTDGSSSAADCTLVDFYVEAVN